MAVAQARDVVLLGADLREQARDLAQRALAGGVLLELGQLRLRLFEALEISDGRIGTSKTRGLGVSARGLFKLWKSRHIGNEIVDLLAERMSIQYFMAITNRNSDLESTFHGISIVLMAR